MQHTTSWVYSQHWNECILFHLTQSISKSSLNVCHYLFGRFCFKPTSAALCCCMLVCKVNTSATPLFFPSKKSFVWLNLLEWLAIGNPLFQLLVNSLLVWWITVEQLVNLLLVWWITVEQLLINSLLVWWITVEQLVNSLLVWWITVEQLLINLLLVWWITVE